MSEYIDQSSPSPHTVVALVEDRPGVLSNVVADWQSKGFNILSLAVGASERPGMSRMTFVVDGASDAEELIGHLKAMDAVAEIHDISDREFVSRELALIRVSGQREVRKRLMDIVDIFNAKIIDVSSDSMIIEVTGHESKINSLVRLLQDYEVVELVRTGRVSVLRGK